MNPKTKNFMVTEWYPVVLLGNWFWRRSNTPSWRLRGLCRV